MNMLSCQNALMAAMRGKDLFGLVRAGALRLRNEREHRAEGRERADLKFQHGFDGHKIFNAHTIRSTGDQLFFCPERTSSRRLWAGAGERRRRASEPLFAAPPVATRNGLAPPPPRGALVTPDNSSKRGLPKPRISPQSPTDYGTEPLIL